MVCNIAPPKVLHVPDWHALVTCPRCRAKRPVPYFDLKRTGRALDGSAEWMCNPCRHQAAAGARPPANGSR